MNKVELNQGVGDWSGNVRIDGKEVFPTKVLIVMEAGKMPEVRMMFLASEVTAIVDQCMIDVVKEDDPK